MKIHERQSDGTRFCDLMAAPCNVAYVTKENQIVSKS